MADEPSSAECTWCHGHLERIEIGGVVIIVCDDCGLTAEVEVTDGAPGRTGEEDRGVRRDSGPA